MPMLPDVLAARAAAPAARFVMFAPFGRSRLVLALAWSEQQIPPLRFASAE
jgi:hypothetical protein